MLGQHCECESCTTVNSNVRQCRTCTRYNSELQIEREKWMRHEDDSWTCQRCFDLNKPLDEKCNYCGAGSETMHLDDLKHSHSKSLPKRNVATSMWLETKDNKSPSPSPLYSTFPKNPFCHVCNDVLVR
jgi:hypothetical protein